jgi:hypothetical protein
VDVVALGKRNRSHKCDKAAAAGDAADFAFKDMDSLPPSPAAAALSHLWLRFRLPSATTSTNAQNIQITLTAVQPN